MMQVPRATPKKARALKKAPPPKVLKVRLLESRARRSAGAVVARRAREHKLGQRVPRALKGNLRRAESRASARRVPSVRPKKALREFTPASSRAQRAQNGMHSPPVRWSQ